LAGNEPKTIVLNLRLIIVPAHLLHGASVQNKTEFLTDFSARRQYNAELRLFVEKGIYRFIFVIYAERANKFVIFKNRAV
jgi:hypothetical protein